MHTYSHLVGKISHTHLLFLLLCSSTPRCTLTCIFSPGEASLMAPLMTKKRRFFSKWVPNASHSYRPMILFSSYLRPSFLASWIFCPKKCPKFIVYWDRIEWAYLQFYDLSISWSESNNIPFGEGAVYIIWGQRKWMA